MTDKELLEFAAKAAGIKLQWVEHCTPPHAGQLPAQPLKSGRR